MNRYRTFAAMTLALGLLATSAQAQDPNKGAAVGRSVGGDEFTDESHSGDLLKAVHVRSGTSVDAIRFVYDKGDQTHGGGGGSFHGESIASDEYIGEVTVTYDNMVDSV